MTEKKLKSLLRSPEELVKILDNLHDGIIAHDMNRKIFFFNRAAERITGYRREDVIGKDCHKAFGEPFCGERCLFDDTKCDREPLAPHVEYPVKLVTKDGEIRELEMSVSSIESDKGEPEGVIAAFRDLTDLVSSKLRSGEMKSFSNIIGNDYKMLQIFQQIRDLAPYDYPVHISGETGTGKELVAEAIHNESRRAGGPFVPINCGALPVGLIESELFGHVKGAFSGAIREKKGRFELAHNGTVFLDEVAELPKETQVKLLRFLQTGKFEKVGGERTVSVDVRIISATNKDLKQEVEKGNFREDLYYRLNVIPVHLPPLRERKGDIPLLVHHFLSIVEQHRGLRPRGISKEAMAMLMDYDWPGNVRQLQNVLQFATVKCGGRMITPDDLPIEFKRISTKAFSGVASASYGTGRKRKLDPESVAAALKQTGGNKVRAAKILGVGRATLYRFLAAYPGIAEKFQQL